MGLQDPRGSRERFEGSSNDFEAIYRVFFLTGPPLNLLSAGQKLADLKKNVRAADWPPLGIENVKVFGICPLSVAILRTFSK